MSGGAVAAEPLYLLLEKYGHTSAHEVSKGLAHQALESQRRYMKLLRKMKVLLNTFQNL